MLQGGRQAFALGLIFNTAKAPGDIMSSMPEPRYHVFLSYNSRDRGAVTKLAEMLTEQGIKVWLDNWNLVPGERWQGDIDAALQRCDSCAIILGSHGLSDWQKQEMFAAERRWVAEPQSFRLIPVLLPGVNEVSVPETLRGPTWVTFDTPDDAEALRRLVSGIRGLAPGAPGTPQRRPDRSPYRGLKAFDVDDAALFFGREALTEKILARLLAWRSQPNALRIAVIYGSSGSGKSSLARAGVLGSIRAGNVAGFAGATLLVCRPGADPLGSLAAAVIEVSRREEGVAAVHDLKRRMRDDGAVLDLALHHATGGAESPMVVLIDQFEECFTLATDQDATKAFIDNLARAAAAPDGRAMVLLTIRAEDLGRCLAFPALAKAQEESAFPVTPAPDEEGLRRAIEEPANAAGGFVEPALANLLLDDVRDEAGVLPLLQYTLEQLWNGSPDGRPTVAMYLGLGKVGGLLRRKADEVLAYFTENEKRLCRHIFLSLVRPLDGGRYVRRQAAIGELATRSFPESQVLPMVRALAAENARLVTIEDDRQAGEPVVEVAHEELIRSWPQFQTWLKEDQEFRLWCDRLEGARERWEYAGRDRQALLRGKLLDEAEQRLRDERLNERDSAFIEASLAGRRREKLTRRGTIAAAVLALGAGGRVAQIFYRRSQSQAMARRARQETLKGDLHVPISLALEAWRTAETREAEEALHYTVQHARVAAEGHQGRVNALAYSRDGLRLATAGEDGSARLWDADFNETNCEHSAGTPVLAVAFSRDGGKMASGGADGRIVVWNVNQAERPVAVLGEGAPVTRVAFTMDGARLLSAGRDGALRSWEYLNPQAPPQTLAAGAPWTALAMHPGGERVAAGDAAGHASVWNLRGGAPVVELEKQATTINDIAFSADGKRLAIACNDGSASVWTLDPKEKTLDLRSGGGAGISAIAFSPKGHRVVTASRAGFATVWDAATGADLLTLESPDDKGKPFTAVAYRPTGDAEQVAIAGMLRGSNGLVRVYDLDRGRLIGEAEKLARSGS